MDSRVARARSAGADRGKADHRAPHGRGGRRYAAADMRGDDDAAATGRGRVGSSTESVVGVGWVDLSEQFAARPVDELAGAGDIGQRVPPSGQSGSHNHQGRRRIGDVGLPANSKDGGGAGDIECLAGIQDAGSERAGGRVSAAGGDGQPSR